jgi:MFS family permease
LRTDSLSAHGATARFLLLCIGVWLHSADTLVTATIAPSVVDDLGGIAYINWTISLYEVGAIIAGSAAAVLASRWGVKRVFVGAALLYGGGCVMGAAASNMGILVGGRFVQGMGGGMLLTLCYVAVETWFAPKLWSRLFAIIAVIWGGGSLLGPLIGGAFAGTHTWRNAFWAFALQAAVLCALAARWLPAAERPATASPAADGPATDDPPAERTDSSTGKWPVLPLILLSAATLIIAEAGASSDVSSRGMGMAIAGCLLGTGLLYLAARLDRLSQVRLLPAQLLELRHPVGAGLMMVFALSVATTGFWAYGPLIVKILFGTKPLVTGYILAGEAVAWSLATMAVASATPSADPWLIRAGAVGAAVGAAGFAIAVPTGSLAGMVGCGLLQGAGFGLCWPAIVQRTVRFADPAERSLASASVSTVQRGYAVGTAAVGIAANLSGLAEGVSAPAARTAGFWVFAAFIPILMVGILCAWRFTERAPRGIRTFS